MHVSVDFKLLLFMVPCKFLCVANKVIICFNNAAQVSKRLIHSEIHTARHRNCAVLQGVRTSVSLWCHSFAKPRTEMK